ncbi:MAG: GGDEF domain-containing protein [Thermodesulforhabdaceae bacterium]
MDDVELVRLTSKTIAEYVPYPLGIGFRENVLFLNQKTKNILSGYQFSTLPRGTSQDTKSFYLRVNPDKTVFVQVVSLPKEHFFLIFEEFTKEELRDELTGLLSRHHLNIVEPKMLEQASKSKKVAIFFMDLDGFKEVNDNFGHEVGDDVLKGVAQRLLRSLRNTDLCFRWGGDEFLVISPGFVEKIHAGLLARRIIKILSEPFSAGGHKLSVGVSIGIAVCPEDGKELFDLVRKADSAMYEAKEQGGNMYMYYSDEG